MFHLATFVLILGLIHQSKGCGSDFFNCHGDCCKEGEQYCNDLPRQKRCQDCALWKSHCDDPKLPQKCTQYCQKLTTTNAPPTSDLPSTGGPLTTTVHPQPSETGHMALIIGVITCAILSIAFLTWLCWPYRLWDRSRQMSHIYRKLCPPCLKDCRSNSPPPDNDHVNNGDAPAASRHPLLNEPSDNGGGMLRTRFEDPQRESHSATGCIWDMICSQCPNVGATPYPPNTSGQASASCNGHQVLPRSRPYGSVENSRLDNDNRPHESSDRLRPVTFNMSENHPGQQQHPPINPSAAEGLQAPNTAPGFLPSGSPSHLAAPSSTTAHPNNHHNNHHNDDRPDWRNVNLDLSSQSADFRVGDAGLQSPTHSGQTSTGIAVSDSNNDGQFRDRRLYTNPADRSEEKMEVATGCKNPALAYSEPGETSS